MRMKSNTHPSKVVISKKCLQKDGKLLFQMKLKTELGQLLPIQKACPCGVTAAVDFSELWNIVVLFFFIHPIAGWTWHAKKQKQWYTITAIPHTFSHCYAPDGVAQAQGRSWCVRKGQQSLSGLRGAGRHRLHLCRRGQKHVTREPVLLPRSRKFCSVKKKKKGPQKSITE